MTLIVAGQGRGTLWLHADTAVTTHDVPARTPFDAELKLLLLRPHLAVGVAGSLHARERLLTGYDSVPDRELLTWLLQRFRQAQRCGTDVECIIAVSPPDAQLFRVREARVESVGRSWIGDQAAFARYQRALAAVRSSGGLESDPNRPRDEAFRALQEVCDSREHPSVGGIIVTAEYWQQRGFVYRPIGTVSIAQTIADGGEFIRFLHGPESSSSFMYSVMSCVDQPGVSRLAIYVYELQAGILLDPLGSRPRLPIQDVDIDGFVERLRELTGTSFHGGVQVEPDSRNIRFM